MDIVKEFFKEYPNAPSVLKVGDCLFLSNHAGSAQDYANRTGGKVETIENPGKGKAAEAEAKKAEAETKKKAEAEAAAEKAKTDAEAKKLAEAGKKI